MITGNKGEWSELYVLLTLLAEGRLYTADQNSNMTDVYLPVTEIYRQENTDMSRFIKYYIQPQKDVEIYFNGDKIRTISHNVLKENAQILYEKICSGGSKTSAFPIPEVGQIMADLACSKIKAPSSDKADIKLKVHDLKTGLHIKTGFSIKSELGAAPTLLNASGATNFKYKINANDQNLTDINSIDTKSKVMDRVKKASELGMKFCGAVNRTFAGNLMLIDSMMEQILAEMLILYYRDGLIHVSELVTKLEELDPINYRRPGIYRYKIKKFLCAVALGLMPSKEWNGQDEATGGYIIAKTNGDIVAYYLYNRDFFETYLLNNTKLETPSTKKHKFASIVKEPDGNFYMNLNLQIRFL